MPSTKTVSPRVVRAVQKLRNDKKSWKYVGETMGRSETWGKKLLETYNGQTGLRKEPRQKSGPPPKTSEGVDDVIEALAVNFRERNHQDIANTLKEHNLATVSEATVRRRLKKKGFRKTTAILDVLTDGHKQQRVKRCEEMRNRLLEDTSYFNKWWISDEMRVALDEKGAPKVGMDERNAGGW